MIDERTVNIILDRADIVDVVGDFLTLHKQGKDFVALCPFHNDRTPSLHISPSKNICKCFVCNGGGSPISFLMKHENLTFPEAIKYLGRKYGIEVVEKELTPEQLERKSQREKLINANAFARDEFINAMHQEAEGRRVALSYFRERGLTDDTIKNFELGYSPSNWTYLVERAKEKGIELETLEQLGLIVKSSKGDYVDRYRERVIFPIHSISGNVVGFGGRILKKNDKVGKYINSPSSDLYDKSNELYGLYFSKKYISEEDKCLVLEGYMDVLSMYQSGVRNVVASSGTALTPMQVIHIKRLTKNITLLFDADSAGVKAALRGLDICLEQDLKVSVLLLPDGEDPDSFAQSHSLEDVQTYIKEHEEDGLFFKLRMLVSEYGTDPQGQASVIEELAQSLAYINEQITLELYLSAISSQMDISKDALGLRVKEIKRERTSAIKREQYRDQQRQQEDESLTNLSTKAPNSVAPIAEKYHKSKDPFAPYEGVIIQDLIDYGTTFFPNYTTVSGNEGVTGIELIADATKDLRSIKEGLSDKFVSVLDHLLSEHEHNPDLKVSTVLTRLGDDEILFFADNYLLDKYHLSPLHSKYLEEMAQESELTKLLMRDILSLKLYQLQCNVAETLRQIDEHDKNDEEGMNELLEHLTFLNKAKCEASKMLGDRVLTSKDLLDIKNYK